MSEDVLLKVARSESIKSTINQSVENEPIIVRQNR